MIDKRKSLTSLLAFLPKDQEIGKIIQMCRLHPKKDWRHWTDFLGHNLVLSEDRSIIVSKDTSPKITITDIYHKAYPEQLAKISQRAIIVFGETQDHNDACFIWFLGLDGRLRISMFTGGQWTENPIPLSFGMKALRFIVKHLVIESAGPIDHQRMIAGCLIKKVWATPIPLDKTVMTDLLSTNSALADEVLASL